jgi:NOL1/NOP2/fmu family ribosome biogenesis protein
MFLLSHGLYIYFIDNFLYLNFISLFMIEKFKVLNSKDLKKINQLIDNVWNNSLPLDKAYFISEKNRIYMVNRDIEKIYDLRFDSAGLYIGTLENNTFRLSIEGSQLLGPSSKKNILELDENLFKEWLSGKDLEFKSEFKGPVIIKYKNDYCGCGISTGIIIFNYVPKERRSSFN